MTESDDGRLSQPTYSDVRPCPSCGTSPTARTDKERVSVIQCPDCPVGWVIL